MKIIQNLVKQNTFIDDSIRDMCKKDVVDYQGFVRMKEQKRLLRSRIANLCSSNFPDDSA